MSEPILVESFDELGYGQRIWIKDCPEHQTDHNDIILSMDYYEDGDQAWVTSQGFGIYDPNTEHLYDRPQKDNNCIREKRLFRFVDFDENSTDERKIKFANSILEAINKIPAKVK